MKNIKLHIPIGKEMIIMGELNIPSDAKSLVIFSHGSGCSGFSPENRFIAKKLNEEKNATLLMNLLTEIEDRVYERPCNIDVLTDRLVEVTSYARKLKELKDLSIGYFGTGTGAASALQAAARLGEAIHAVVSCGGRPDLAEPLSEVKSPTILIVGSLDKDAIGLNRVVFNRLRCEKELKIVEGASRLFKEPGKLDEVAALTTDWLKRYILIPNYKIHAV